MSFRENLCKLMQNKGVSNYKLAKEIDVHASSVANWKAGTAPQIDHIKRIANFFGVTVDDLLGQEGDSQFRKEDVS